MDERTTVEKRTTVIQDDETADTGSTNINIDGNTGATTIQKNEPVPREKVVRETTVERTTRS